MPKNQQSIKIGPTSLNDSKEVVEIPSNHRHQNVPNVGMRHIYSFHVHRLLHLLCWSRGFFY